MSQENHGNLTAAVFKTTVWHEVIEKDLEALCKAYWNPLYAFLRKYEHLGRQDAEDVVQGFLVHVTREDRLGRVHPSKGKFRNWLLACLKRYVLNWRKAQNSGPPTDLSPSSDDTTVWEPADPNKGDEIFHGEWAKTIVDRALLQLQEEYQKNGKGELFRALAPFLTDHNERGDYAIIADRLKMTIGAVRTAATRLRDEFGELLDAQIAPTVSSPEEIREERLDLIKAFLAYQASQAST